MDMHTELDRARRRGWADAMAVAVKRLRDTAAGWRAPCLSRDAAAANLCVARTLDYEAYAIERIGLEEYPPSEPAPKVVAGPELYIHSQLCPRHGRTLRVETLVGGMRDAGSRPMCVSCIVEKAAVAGARAG